VIRRDGAYLYEALNHLLLPVSAHDLRVQALTPGQPRTDALAPVQLVYVVDIHRLTHTAGFDEPGLHDPEVQKSYYYVDTGLIAGNVYLFAAAYGLAAWFHNCDRIGLARSLGCEPSSAYSSRSQSDIRAPERVLRRTPMISYAKPGKYEAHEVKAVTPADYPYFTDKLQARMEFLRSSVIEAFETLLRSKPAQDVEVAEVDLAQTAQEVAELKDIEAAQRRIQQRDMAAASLACSIGGGALRRILGQMLPCLPGTARPSAHCSVSGTTLDPVIFPCGHVPIVRNLSGRTMANRPLRGGQ